MPIDETGAPGSAAAIDLTTLTKCETSRSTGRSTNISAMYMTWISRRQPGKISSVSGVGLFSCTVRFRTSSGNSVETVSLGTFWNTRSESNIGAFGGSSLAPWTSTSAEFSCSKIAIWSRWIACSQSRID